jgi:stage II sporulation protein P
VIPADEPLVAQGISWFVTPQPTATPQPTIAIAVRRKVATVNAGVLNLRAGPSTDHRIVGQVERGDKLEIVGRNGAGDWLQIVAPDGTKAWIYGRLVTTGADLGKLPVTGVSSAPPPAE